MSRQKYYSAGLMVGVGVFTVLMGQKYSLGTMARMGPGYFPFLLGIVMIVLGALYLFVETAAHDDDDIAARLRSAGLPVERLQPRADEA